MKLMPIVYVTDMERSFQFYRGLGFHSERAAPNTHWTELSLGDAILALHFTPSLPEKLASRIMLTLLAEEPLEAFISRLAEVGIGLERPITDEAFGRSLAVKDPDGMVIQINEHDAELHAG